jgi:flagellin-like protein
MPRSLSGVLRGGPAGFRHHARHRAVSEVIASILLVAITVVLLLVLFFLRIPLTQAPPTVSYDAFIDSKYPVFGDPTDCRPNLPYNWTYYLGNGTGDPRYDTYMNDWWDECEYGNTGVYNQMNATRIVISQVSQPIPLGDLQFEFVCTNYTPTYVQTALVSGKLAGMEWIPGTGAQNFTADSPLIGYCATLRAEGSGASSTYYNRLGFFDPLSYSLGVLTPGQTIVVYLHTLDSVYEAPNPIEPEDTWNLPDGDDYHGAPPWCFTVEGACQIELFDTAWSPAVLLLNIPLYDL